jgi:AcrR family transcriptional regulator
MTSDEKRVRFLPIVTQCFARHGYRGTTTATLAEMCEVRENVLYRIWPHKKAMFLDCLDSIHDVTLALWTSLPEVEGDERSEAERILDFQARDHGKMQHYRLLFAGLMEDDAEIRRGLRKLYRRIHEHLTGIINEHPHRSERPVEAQMAAWAMIGVAAMVDIQRELRMESAESRESMIRKIGLLLLNGNL